MRFSTYINNAKCLEWNLNANQGALFDLLNQAPAWAKEIIIDGVVYYWVSRNAVIEELPLFYSKPDTVYRHFVEFHKKGLIVYQKHGDKDLIRLTEKGKTWNEFNSDLNPTLGNKSELARKQIRKSSDLNPTNNNTNYKNTNDHNNTLTGINAHTRETKKSAVLVLLEQFDITGKLAEDFIVHRKAKKAPITETALNGYQREADKAKIPIQKAVEIAIERGWTGFKADWQWQDEQPKHRPKDNMRAEWNTPEAWAEVL
ncbi:hypothetical protein [Mannheimia haemolytica]|uniref:Uncharacterized protein n=2 Tax=Mannheimia haemolytica TaxID=75985 RepID=A0A378N166_MANHA|nr:hypothetical protein [Mannheimia haemolytica]UQX61966.1 hypothetical protein M3709_07165 [Mannheimia haemolytica]STY61385.1 Uncharacterised protein [Mannheimia haemolytica]